MANYNQAPELRFNGTKGKGQFYQLPQDLMDKVFKELGNSSAQLRIMIVLLGTKEGFKISDKWICDRTGLQHPSYVTARKALVARGWLEHDPAKGITINIAAICGNSSNTTLPQNDNNENSRGNTILPHCSNTILPQRGNTILPIIDNTDNKTDKKEISQVERYPRVSKWELAHMGCKYEETDIANHVRILATNRIVEVV